MPLNWIDVSQLSFNSLLLLESVQLSWLPGWVREDDLALALRLNPAVEWYLRHKCPRINAWVDQVMALASEIPQPEEARRAEVAVMGTIEDLVLYAVNPGAYDAQPFLGWDDRELTGLVDMRGKWVIDVGSGTGRLALVAAAAGVSAAFAVEPVANLRAYIKDKSRRLGYKTVYPVDGLITDLPFPDDFADVVMGGHVFGGDEPEEEYQEMLRVIKPGGMLILCPGNNDLENDAHRVLVARGCQWSRFVEPPGDIKRKYWRVKD